MRAARAVPDVLGRHRGLPVVLAGLVRQARPLGRHAVAARREPAAVAHHPVECHGRVAASRAGPSGAPLVAVMLVHGPSGVADCLRTSARIFPSYVLLRHGTRSRAHEHYREWGDPNT